MPLGAMLRSMVHRTPWDEDPVNPYDSKFESGPSRTWGFQVNDEVYSQLPSWTTQSTIRKYLTGTPEVMGKSASYPASPAPDPYNGIQVWGNIEKSPFYDTVRDEPANYYYDVSRGMNSGSGKKPSTKQGGKVVKMGFLARVKNFFKKGEVSGDALDVLLVLQRWQEQLQQQADSPVEILCADCDAPEELDQVHWPEETHQAIRLQHLQATSKAILDPAAVRNFL